MDIPYIDLVAQHAPLKAELLQAVAGVIDHGQFVLGPEVAEFEHRFADLCGVPYAAGVSSGTDALVLALRALGVGPGDEVITVPNSFVASVSCIELAGARPVLVDVRDDYTIDPEKIPAALSPRTKAILPVHLTGRPCDMDPLMAIARQHGLAVVEDCAQAVTAEYAGRRVGSIGAIGCFSFHPLKTLSALGDAGAITCHDAGLCERLKVMRNLGLRTRDDCVEWSGNSRLDAVQAAMLAVKLKYVDGWTERRRRHAAEYRERLAGLPWIRIPEDGPTRKAVYHTLVVEADDRDALRTCLSARGIGTAIHYPVPVHLTTAGRSLGYPAGSFPVAERQAARIVSLPVYPELTTSQIDRVCDAIRAFYADRRS